MTEPIQIPFLNTREELLAFQAEHGIREDWHEPDEQGVTIAFRRGEHGFDNAMCDRSEDFVALAIDGKPVAAVNAALLFAFACGFEGIG